MTAGGVFSIYFSVRFSNSVVLSIYLFSDLSWLVSSVRFLVCICLSSLLFSVIYICLFFIVFKSYVILFGSGFLFILLPF